MPATRRPQRSGGWIHFQIATRSRRIPRPAKILGWARAARRSALEVTIRIVAEREGRRICQAYRGGDHATNVLTFCYGRERGRLSGDIVLCAPVIEREAREQGKAADAHYAHLTVHGMLHLQGLDHRNRREAERMEAREKTILAGLGYPDPYE